MSPTAQPPIWHNQTSLQINQIIKNKQKIVKPCAFQMWHSRNGVAPFLFILCRSLI